jgi:hypothetical protein
VPTSAGVAEIVAADGQSLLVARASNLRKWFATRLGHATVKPGARPPTDLTAVAAMLRWRTTTSPFAQRLAFERLMSERFPGINRRDLKPPVYLRLDASERFPRVTVETRGSVRSHHADRFGPFRDRAAAEKALHALHKLFPLRPCDFTFEPHPELTLGVNCFYAQVRTCAAPCLSRVSEDAYRGLARDVARFLTAPSVRTSDAETWLRPYVTSSAARAVVLQPTRRAVELYPIVSGVVGTGVTVSSADAAEAAIASLDWSPPAAEEAGRDEAWLASWLFQTQRRPKEGGPSYRILESV